MGSSRDCEIVLDELKDWLKQNSIPNKGDYLSVLYEKNAYDKVLQKLYELMNGEDSKLHRFKVGLCCGGIMEDPDIHYENIQIIEAATPEEAKKHYDEVNNCNYYYGEVLGRLD